MNIIETPSHNFSERSGKITSLVLHYTGMKSCSEAVSRMQDKAAEVSAHYCIDKNGDIYKLVDESKKAWHSGKSFWRGVEGLNDSSIGIEIANNGHEFGYELFPKAQIQAVTKLCQDIIAKHKIDFRNIVGHSDIAPDRKEDPGELFPWQYLAECGVGFFHGINYQQDFHYRQPFFSPNEESKEIGEMQRKLAIIGYKIQKTTILDEQTIKVITAFYRRFLPERITLSKNSRYPENIKWDSLADVILNDVFVRYNF
jgi:N-acetylmuramoyl-L-alanine amidase